MALRAEVRGELGNVPRDAWNALVGEGSPFLEWDWLAGLEETGCVAPDTGWLPQHVTVWEGERLVAAAPLYVKGHSAGEFIFDWGWAEAAARFGVRYYPKLLCAVPFTPAAGARLMVAPGTEAEEGARRTALAQAIEEVAARLGLSSAHVLFAPEEEAAALEARGWLRRTTMQFQWRNHGYATFDDFLARVGAKKRAQIRRERREVARAGVTVEPLVGDAVTPELLDLMYRWHTGTVEKWRWSDQYLNARFYALVGERFRHRVHLVVARREGRPIAAAFNVLKGGALWGRYWGCAEEVPFLHFEVCYYAAIEDCIRRGVGLFSPGAGGEHKYHRAFEPEAQHSVHRVHDARFAAALRPALEKERMRVRADIAALRAGSPLRRAAGEGGSESD